jgi:hypothetical protein
MSVPVLLLPNLILTMPPALKKYLALAASAKVTVCVNVMVHVTPADPVAVVLLVVPEKVPYSVPDTTALPRFVVQLVKSALTAGNIAITAPAVGADREVRVVAV